MTVMQGVRAKRSAGWTARDLRAVQATKIVPWFESSGRAMSIRRGAVLFREGEYPEGIFYVRSGRIEVCLHSASGRCMRVMTAGRSHILGLEAVFSNQAHESTARSLGVATVYFVPRGEFFAFLEANPDVRLRMLHLLSEELIASYGLIRQTLDVRSERPLRQEAPDHAAQGTTGT